ncbi:MAG: 2-dehydropantoate 2-reductase, partial [Caldilineaceae bacterium]|nr:2-dehydropantoate 2-reductase [Caldilineaceae bacterium]
MTAQGAAKQAPGQLRHAGDGLTVLADLPSRSQLLTRLANALNRGQIQTEIRPAQQTTALAWEKLTANAAINPLTALFETPNGALLDDPALKELMIGAARETAVVAAAQGITLSFDDPMDYVLEVASRTATNHSSMWQDIRRGAATEIEAITGAVIAAGRRCQTPTPLNVQLYELICAKMAGERLTHTQL